MKMSIEQLTYAGVFEAVKVRNTTTTQQWHTIN